MQRRNLSPMIKAKLTIECPDCKMLGRTGTLEPLTKQELKNLKENNKGDKLPKRILACDECKYWIDADDI